MSNGSYNFVPIVDNRTVFSDYSARAESGGLANLPTLAGVNTRETSALFSLSLSSVNETEIYDDLQTTFNCPLQESVRIRLEQKVPIWRYLYHGNFTNLSPTSWLGAYHTGEVPMVFGTYNMSLSETGPASMEEIAASKYIQDAWVAFAKDPQNGLHRFGWPQFNFDGDTLINLALNNTSTAIFTSSEAWDSPCNGGTFVP
ncbi:Carboxylesterase type B [Penicillium cataractarum]|uniref:Carboxylesterase type B n=1 Tax=Penicillium cataractarum TaxID=2100454 RepID=A0A9W9RYQ1_9EURO|nr:Carboxylesterase type B [Penicillium cataractarum]KAJ5368821.1 Carboxylesterase type B [Penicillium cataractarum]